MSNALFDVECSNRDGLWEKLKNADNLRLLAIRDKLESMWETYQPFADLNFRQEFARNVHQRFWEIYLAHHLLDQGKNLISRAKQSIKGPDILIEEEERRIWIEAVAPTPGQCTHPDRVPPLLTDENVHPVPGNELLLRVTGSLLEKRKKYLQYSNDGVVEHDDLCIIAFNGGDMEGFEIFGGERYVHDAFYPTRIKVSGEEEWNWGAPWRITKSSGKVIEASVFASSEFQHIAGAIISSDSISSLLAKPNLQYFSNPNCSQSLPQKWMPWSNEMVITKDRAGLVMETIKADGTTFSTVVGPFPRIDA